MRLCSSVLHSVPLFQMTGPYPEFEQERPELSTFFAALIHRAEAVLLCRFVSISLSVPGKVWGLCRRVLLVPDPQGQYSGIIRFIEKPGVQDQGGSPCG